MEKAFLTDFFYGDEAEQFTFFRIPRLLITSPHFRGLSTEAKLLYGMMLDRMGLSLKNGWHEEDGRVYIYYTVDEIAEDLNCGREKAIKLVAELDDSKGFGLIFRKRQGQGKPTKIYVKRFTSREVPYSEAAASRTVMAPEVGKTDNKKSDGADLLKSENPTSRSRRTGLQEVGKSDPNKNNNSYTDLTHTQSVNPSLVEGPQIGAQDGPKDGEREREIIKNQIDYAVLPFRLNRWELRQAKELVEIMVEVSMNRAPTIKIGQAEYNTAYVQNRLTNITCEDIETIIHNLAEAEGQVKNIRAYLLASLFNATATTFNRVTLGPN